jgi:thiol-disulfide isomerase/thioredoxin
MEIRRVQYEKIKGREMKKKKKNAPLTVVISSLIGLCLIGYLGFRLVNHFFAPNIQKYKLENSSLQVGGAAPDFELISLDGETVRLSQFKGQSVLISIGATWCPDCRKETPLLEEAYKKHPELVVLLIDSQEGADVVQNFANEFGITHPVLLVRSQNFTR